MPTPFYHLSLAGELLNRTDLPSEIQLFLEENLCEFMFGNTAPDVQVISGQPREATHFFELPIQAGDTPPWEQLLFEYPHLSEAGALDGVQVAFLAGYMCHLQADWRWIKDIFAPVFGPGCAWGTFSKRLYYHNVLRAYLDLNILTKLPAGMEACLGGVRPIGWLPFVSDQHLVEWRDFLARQLRPGEAIQTVEVFSSRQGISAPEYYALMQSELRMQQEIFSHISLDAVELYHQYVLNDNVRMLTHYLAFTLHPRSITFERRIFRGAQL